MHLLSEHLLDLLVDPSCTMQVSSTPMQPPSGSSGSGPTGQPSRQIAAAPTPLSFSDVQAIQEAWLALSPPNVSDRNKLLARHLKAMAMGDPYAYDIAKQDSKEYM